ncbi:MAG: AEC family transporter [Desulfobulbaceae bacterium]|nr:AEC family transporter [Desulfobulbaceae bacterium]
MWTVIEIVIPVFLLIGLGYLVRRIGLVDDHFFKQANGLIYYICLPTLLIYKIATADFSTSFNFKLVVATSAAVGCCFFISYVYGRIRKYPPPIQGAFCQGSFRGNLAYIGLAIIYNGYGDVGLTRAGVLLGFLVPVLNFFAILALTLPRQLQRESGDAGKSFSGKDIAKQIIINPLILASLIGLLWSFFQIPMPTILDRSLSIATGMTLPLALLSIGGSFSLANLQGDLWKAGAATAIKLILLPLITTVFMLLLGISGLDFAIGLLMAGAPTAVTTYIMACQMDADGELAGSIVVMATGFSAVSYTILLFCLQLFGI